MSFEIIHDHSKLKPGDLLEYRCPVYGLVTQWRVHGVFIGALGVENLVKISSITERPQFGNPELMVPEKLVRSLTIIRPVRD